MSEKKPTTVQVTKTPILMAHKEEIRQRVSDFVNHCGNDIAVRFMASVLNFDKERGCKAKSSIALISDALEGRDDALLFALDEKIKLYRDMAKDRVWGKYRVIDAETGKEKDGKYFVLKVDAKDEKERMAVYYALKAYADFQYDNDRRTYAESVGEYNDGFKPSPDFIRIMYGTKFSSDMVSDIRHAIKEAADGRFVAREYYDELNKRNDDLCAENLRLSESVKSLRRADKIGTFLMILGPIVTAFAFIILKVKGIW